jgi:hypothetical protein
MLFVKKSEKWLHSYHIFINSAKIMNRHLQVHDYKYYCYEDKCWIDHDL